MKHYLLQVWIWTHVFVCQAQITIQGSFVHGGITRTYSFYVPASYSPGTPVPLVFNLHGLGTDGAYQAQYRDFRPIADTANFIVVHPDGSTMLGQRFWNYGNVLGSTVDDVGFLEQLIDEISADYSINQQRIYCAGMSNGSFMAYYLACQSSRFAAIGTVTGSMSVAMYNSCSPDHPVPVLHIHGTADNTNPYAGTSTMKGVDETNQFWVNQLSCAAIPVETVLPDIITSDNSVATHYRYSGGIGGRTVELFKVTGGGHTWPGSPVPGSSGNTCMDFDATREIWRFFSRYDLQGVLEVPVNAFPVWDLNPNPSTGIITVHWEGGTPEMELQVYDLYGKLVSRIRVMNGLPVDLVHLQAGSYQVRLFGDGVLASKKKLVIAR